MSLVLAGINDVNFQQTFDKGISFLMAIMLVHTPTKVFRVGLATAYWERITDNTWLIAFPWQGGFISAGV
jgi:hypothetical protein